MTSTDWICEACNGPIIPLGQLGTREHGRCRLCALDHNRPAQLDPEEGDLTEEEIAAGLAQFNDLFGNPILTRPGESLIETVQEARDEDFNNDMKPRS